MQQCCTPNMSTQNVISFTGSLICPVHLFKLHTDHLHPEISTLWQKPRQKFDPRKESVWFEQKVIGHDPLNNFMKNISVQAKLSQIYTNYCLHTTIGTELDQAGYASCHIMTVTGHKSENSVKKYATKTLNSKKREMFETLSKNLQPSPKKCH